MKEQKKQQQQQQQEQLQYEHLPKVYISDPDYVWLPASIVSIKKSSETKEEAEAEVKIDYPSNWSTTTTTAATSTTAAIAAIAATTDANNNNNIWTSYYEDDYGDDDNATTTTATTSNKKNHYHRRSNSNSNSNSNSPSQEQQKQKKFCVSRNSNNNDDTTMVTYTPGYYEWPLRATATTATATATATYNDVVDIPFLNEASVFYNLKQRYVAANHDHDVQQQQHPLEANQHQHQHQQIYTRVNRDILLAINPYQYLPLYYNKQKQQQYANQIVWNYNNFAQSSSLQSQSQPRPLLQNLEPHIYESSSVAYKRLLSLFNDDDIDDAAGGVDNDDDTIPIKQRKKDQTIVVTGESGAGKTETVKLLCMHLTTMEQSPKLVVNTTTNTSCVDNNNNPIGTKCIQSSYILEAFGNATTPNNHNSSRFGKQLTLNYESERKEIEETLHNYRNMTTTNIPTLVSATSTTFLLEKNRVISQNKGKNERSFHIFYQLLAAPSAFKKQLFPNPNTTNQNTDNELSLLFDFENCRTHDFKYLIPNDTISAAAAATTTTTSVTNSDSNNSSNSNNNKKDSDMWFKTMNALQNVCQMEEETLLHLMRTMMIILQLGNIVFGDNDDDNATKNTTKEITLLASMMGIPMKDLKKALTKRILKTTHDEVAVDITSNVAKHSCDSFAKEMYARIFDRIVREVNEHTTTKTQTTEQQMYNHHNNNNTADDNNNNDKKKGKDDDTTITSGSISVLDMFGFECYDDNTTTTSSNTSSSNRFYQLCMNYANEQLQAKFVLDNFKLFTEEYEPEGIRIFDSNIVTNGAAVLDLLDSGRWKNGIIDLINEECRLPKGNESSFVHKVKTVHKNHKQFMDITTTITTDNNNNNNNSEEKGTKSSNKNNKEFSIIHYNGYPVTYNATNFIQQNTDMLPESLISIAANKSTNPFIRSEFKKLHFILQLASGGGGMGMGGMLSPSPLPVAGGMMMMKIGMGGSGAGSNNFRKFQQMKSRSRSRSEPTPASFLVNRNTVLENFRKDIQGLLSSMKNTNVRYIRCLKPNGTKQPKVVDHKTMIRQLKSTGIMTAIALGKETFTDILGYKDIISRYECCYKYYYNNNNNSKNNSGKNGTTKATTAIVTTATLQKEDENNSNSNNNDSKNVTITNDKATKAATATVSAADASKMIARDKVESMFSVLFQFLDKYQQQKDKMFAGSSHSSSSGSGSNNNNSKKQNKHKKKKKNQKEQQKAAALLLTAPLHSSSVSAAMTPLRNNYCVYGKTKVFFRSGAIDHLEKQRHHVRSSLVVTIQKWIRMVLSVQKYKQSLREHRFNKYDSMINNMNDNLDNKNNNSNTSSKNSSNDRGKNSSGRRRPRRRLSLPSFGSSSSSSNKSSDSKNNINDIDAVNNNNNNNNKDANGFITYYNNPSPLLEYNSSYQYPYTLPPSSPLLSQSSYPSSRRQSFTANTDNASTSNYCWNSEAKAWKQQKPQQPKQQKEEQAPHKPARRRMSLPMWQQQPKPQQQQEQQEEHQEQRYCWNSETKAWQQQKPQQSQQQKEEQAPHKTARRRMSLPMWQQQPKPQQQQQEHQEQKIHKPARQDKSRNSSSSSSSRRRPRRRLSLPSFGSSSSSKSSESNNPVDNEKHIDGNGFNTNNNNASTSLGYNNNSDVYPYTPSPSSYISKWGEQSFAENDGTSNDSWNNETKAWQQQKPQQQQQPQPSPQQQENHSHHKPARRRMSLPLWQQQPKRQQQQQKTQQLEQQQARKPARRRMSLPLWQQQPKPEQEQEAEPQQIQQQQQQEESHKKPARRRLSLQCWNPPKQDLESQLEQEKESQQQEPSYTPPARRARRRLSLPLSYINNADDNNNDDNIGGSERGPLSSSSPPSSASLSSKKKQKSRRRFSLLSSFGSTKDKEHSVTVEEKKEEQQQKQRKQRRQNPFSPKRFFRRSSLSSVPTPPKVSFDSYDAMLLYERQQKLEKQQKKQQQEQIKKEKSSRRRRWSLLGSRGGVVDTISPVDPPMPTPSDNQRSISSPAVLTSMPSPPKDVTYFNNGSSCGNNDNEDKYMTSSPPKFENTRNNNTQGQHHLQEQQHTVKSIAQHDAVPNALTLGESDDNIRRRNSMISINSSSSCDSSSSSIIDFNDIIEANKQQKENLLAAAMTKEKRQLLSNNTDTTEQQDQPPAKEYYTSINSIINKKGRTTNTIESPGSEVTDRTVTERFSSISSVTSDNRSTSDELSFVNTNSNKEKRRVSFGSIEIRKHPIILGDHPSCRHGVPITIDWKHFEKTEQMIDEYETERLGSRRHKYQLVLGPMTRKYILKEETGVSDDRIFYTTMAVQRIQKDRMESLRCKELTRELKKDRLYSKINAIVGRKKGPRSGGTGGKSKWWSGLQQGTAVGRRRQQEQRKGNVSRRYSM